MSQRNILIAVDESKASERAFEWALENFYKPDQRNYITYLFVQDEIV